MQVHFFPEEPSTTFSFGEDSAESIAPFEEWLRATGFRVTRSRIRSAGGVQVLLVVEKDDTAASSAPSTDQQPAVKKEPKEKKEKKEKKDEEPAAQ